MKVVYPYGRIRKNHQNGSLLRRGMGLMSGIVPPILASARALSRSTRAFMAVFTIAVFPDMPVSFCAFANSSSSMFTVVLMAITSFQISRTQPVYQT